MKISKSNKILILITAVVLCFIVAFSFNFSKKVVKADESNFKLTSTTFKVEGDTITLIDGYKYKKGSAELFVEDNNSSPIVKYTFGSSENRLSFEEIESGVTLIQTDSEFVFNGEGTAKLKVGNSGFSYNIDITTDDEVPTYLLDKLTFDSEMSSYEDNTLSAGDRMYDFMEALKKNLKVKVTVDDIEKEYYKPLGSGKYITLPSMKAFVSDDTTPYEEMTYVVYYKNSKSDTSYTSGTTKVGANGGENFKIPVEVPGDYYFYIVFKDAHGNEMDKEKCKDFSFKFTIYEDYPVQVNVSDLKPSNGYLNVLYKLGTSIFDVTDNCNKTYTLEFSQTEDGEYKDITKDENVDFSSSELSFIPTEKGFYKITCTAKSTSTGIENSNFVIVEISDEPTVINKPDGPFVAWIKGHVVSVVFLCLGFVCLVGIVVLLFVKPKEGIDEEPKSKETNKKRNKN